MIKNISMKISIAAFGDLEKILELQKTAYIQEAEIYNDFSIQPLAQTMDSLLGEWQNGIVLKAVADGQIIGSVRAQRVDHVCKIGKLIVSPNYQNKGIGRKLMAEIESTFQNCSVYELFTGSMSKKNLALYRKLGYKDYQTEQINSRLTLIFLRKQNRTDCEFIKNRLAPCGLIQDLMSI